MSKMKKKRKRKKRRKKKNWFLMKNKMNMKRGKRHEI